MSHLWIRDWDMANEWSLMSSSTSLDVMGEAWRLNPVLTITLFISRSRPPISFREAELDILHLSTCLYDASVQLLKLTGMVGWRRASKDLSQCWRHWDFQSVEKGSTPIPCILMMDPRDEGTTAAPKHTFHSNNTVIRSSGTTGQGSVLTSCQSSPSLSTSFSLETPSQTLGSWVVKKNPL